MVDSDRGKLFVGGISWETSEAILRDYFSRYGDVLSSSIAKDRFSGTPRGFGFITFANPSSADRALNDHHEISGRTVDVKRAIPRTEHLQQHHQNYPDSSISSTSANTDSQFRAKKIFVGGLSASLTEEEFKGYFEKFGRITDVVLMHDNVTNRPRGFGFITFESEDVVDNITKNSFHELGGRCVEVKRAIPKELSRNLSNGQNSRFGGGGSAPYGGYWQENYEPDNFSYGFYPGHGYVSPYGYGGVYGSGYHIAGPGYGSVGYYGMPMMGYGPMHYDPAFAYPMNGVYGAGSCGAGSFGARNGVETGKSEPDEGSNYEEPDNDDSGPNCKGSSAASMRQSRIHNKSARRSLAGGGSHSYEGISADCSAALDP